jgi:hypothetical protein
LDLTIIFENWHVRRPRRGTEELLSGFVRCDWAPPCSFILLARPAIVFCMEFQIVMGPCTTRKCRTSPTRRMHTVHGSPIMQNYAAARGSTPTLFSCTHILPIAASCFELLPSSLTYVSCVILHVDLIQ